MFLLWHLSGAYLYGEMIWMNAKVLRVIFLRGYSGCVCTSGQLCVSSGSDGSEGSMVCLHAAKTAPCLQAGWHLHCSLGTVPDLHCPPNSCLDAVKLVWIKTRSFEQLDCHMSAVIPFVC